MQCPVCNAWTEVKETRGSRRRRVCANEHLFWTNESVLFIGSRRPGPARRPVQAHHAQTGELVAAYDSIKDAALHGFDTGNIQACLAGRQKTHKGLVWSRPEPEKPNAG